jgi:hypothetical protein
MANPLRMDMMKGVVELEDANLSDEEIFEDDKSLEEKSVNGKQGKSNYTR